MWMSPLEILKLSIGLADFTCCQRNHVITTETQKVMNGGEVKKIPCDKPIAGGILEQLIDAKINHLFNAEGDMVMARLHCSLKIWWMRELKENKKITRDDMKSTVEKFKIRLRWDKGHSWFDHGGVGLLMYAVGSNEENVVIELLEELKRDFEGREYTKRIESRMRDEGYTALGIPGRSTALTVSMMLASPKIVELLIEHGANVDTVDVMGNDAFMLGSVFGREVNIQFWLKRFKDYDLEQQKAMLGATPLIAVVNMGANKIKSVKVLCESGARVDALTHAGFSVLMAACANEDSGPMVVKEILSRLDRRSVNYTMRSQSIKWKVLRGCAKLAVRCGLVKSVLAHRLAHGAGLTALHYAARRGDVEIVKLLLEAGADPYIENEMGLNSFDITRNHGPFPSVMRVLNKNGNK